MKIVVIGDHGVGKKSFIETILNYYPYIGRTYTVGFTAYKLESVFDDKTIKFQIWILDPSYETRDNLYMGSLGGIIVFDVTRPETFENLQKWIKEISNKIGAHMISLVIVGNKVDLRESGQYSQAIADEVAIRYVEKLSEQTIKHGFSIEYCPVSSETKQGLDRPINILAHNFLKLLKSKGK